MLRNVDHLELVQEIRASLAEIRDDLNTLRQVGGALTKLQVPTCFDENFYVGEMEMCLLKLDRDLLDVNERKVWDRDPVGVQLRCAHRLSLAPTCSSLVARHPQIRQLYFHTLQPNSSIGAHYGVHGDQAVHLRVQVTLDPGERCYFYCNSSELLYRPELIFAFDDGHDLHWVENRGSLPRTVLILDLWR